MRHDFYLTAGAAAATLIGLLFVGISINLDEFCQLAASAANSVWSRCRGLARARRSSAKRADSARARLSAPARAP